jgi:hypothetical protein
MSAYIDDLIHEFDDLLTISRGVTTKYAQIISPASVQNNVEKVGDSFATAFLLSKVHDDIAR